jgi:hypothetical protein
MYTLIDRDAESAGTSLKGHIQATYDELVARFGKPKYDGEPSGDGKVDVEWCLEFENSEGDSFVATIYNWKDYDGGVACKSGPYTWHIGGKSWDSVEAVMDYGKEMA